MNDPKDEFLHEDDEDEELELKYWCDPYDSISKYEKFPKCEYIQKKMNAAYCIWYMAEMSDSYELYEKFFNEVVELMRYSILVSADMIYSFVMALIAMGRDNDAYNTIKYWVVIGSTPFTDIQLQFNNLNPGEWLHSPNQNEKENVYR